MSGPWPQLFAPHGNRVRENETWHLEAMRRSIRYLALPCGQVADELGVLEGSYIRRWRDMFVVLADQLEPDGSLSSRIRPGAVPILCAGRLGAPYG
jgi:hypothetical protein